LVRYIIDKIESIKNDVILPLRELRDVLDKGCAFVVNSLYFSLVNVVLEAFEGLAFSLSNFGRVCDHSYLRRIIFSSIVSSFSEYCSIGGARPY